MRVITGVIIALLAAAVPVAAARVWTSGFGQGTMEYMIRNDAGASFSLYCNSGSANPAAGFFVDSKQIKLAEPKLTNIEVVLVIDGEDDGYFTECQPGQCHFASFNFRTDRDLQNTTARLRKAKTFSLRIPALGVSEKFSTRGAAKAIEADALTPCQR